jgi:biotin synthase
MAADQRLLDRLGMRVDAAAHDHHDTPACP